MSARGAAVVDIFGNHLTWATGQPGMALPPTRDQRTLDCHGRPARQRTSEAGLVRRLRRVGTKDLQIVAILLTPDQFTVVAAMFSWPTVEKRRMMNVPEQVDVHRLTV